MQKVTDMALRRYIDKCAADAAAACGRENDIRYEYKLVSHNLIFAFRCKYHKVRLRFEYRLFNNLPKNFGLKLHLVMPTAGVEYEDAVRACCFMYSEDTVDVKDSIGVWDLFGTPVVIVPRYAIYPDGTYSLHHEEELRSAGYDINTVYPVPEGSNHLQADWDIFLSAYKKLYGCTPEETAIKVLEQRA